MKTKTLDPRLRKVGRCINSAQENWYHNAAFDEDTLSDIEVDLEAALDELREYRRHAAHVAVYGNAPTEDDEPIKFEPDQREPTK